MRRSIDATPRDYAVAWPGKTGTLGLTMLEMPILCGREKKFVLLSGIRTMR